MGMKLLIVAVFAAVLATVFSCGVGGGTNIDKREAYWRQELPTKVPVGTIRADLETFAGSRGVRLECYQDGARRDVCAFRDPESHGGTSKIPMRLLVVFVMKDNAVTGYDYGPVPEREA
jgi:hypothetical protein